MRPPSFSRRQVLCLVGIGALAALASPIRAKDVWTSGITRTRMTEFATEVVSNLPDEAQRTALPRMVQLLWTFDAASAPDAAELRRVQDRVLADAQALVKTPHNLHLVAIGRAREAAFWCFYVPESFKHSDLTDSLAGFDSPDQAMALRLRNRLSTTLRRDPRWTWVEAYLREIARK